MGLHLAEMVFLSDSANERAWDYAEEFPQGKLYQVEVQRLDPAADQQRFPASYATNQPVEFARDAEGRAFRDVAPWRVFLVREVF